MEVLKQSSFNLPNAQKVDVVYIKLADGRIVARTKDELEPRPAPSPIVGEPRRI